MSIPAPDGTLNQLHLDLALPLTVPYVFYDGSAATVIPTTSTATWPMMQFRMPFYGDVVFQGWVQMQTSPGVQQVDTAIDARSTPAPTTNPYTTWRTEGGPGQTVLVVPVMANWVNVQPGTLVDIILYINNGSGGPSLQLGRTFCVAYCTKT